MIHLNIFIIFFTRYHKIFSVETSLSNFNTMKLLAASLLGVAYSDCPGFCEANDLDGNPNDCSNRGNINADIFLSYGVAAGDEMGPFDDDEVAGPITFSEDVTFFGNQYNDFYWSTNGLMTFGEEYDSYDSDPFPIDDVPLFSPFWADLYPSDSESDMHSGQNFSRG